MNHESDNPYASPQSSSVDPQPAGEFEWDDRCDRITAVLRRSDVSASLAAVYAVLYSLMIVVAGIGLFQMDIYGIVEWTVVVITILLALIASYLLAAAARAIWRLRCQPGVRQLHRVLAAHTRLFMFGSVTAGFWMCGTVLSTVLQWLAR